MLAANKKARLVCLLWAGDLLGSCDPSGHGFGFKIVLMTGHAFFLKIRLPGIILIRRKSLQGQETPIQA
jgi:hypothetical protein